MGVPTNDLNSAFWLAVGTMVFGFLGVTMKYAYKSKCSHVDCCCIKITRDVHEEVQEDMVEITNKNDTTNREPETP